ncbi:Cell cycle checkpoint protein RAD17 [Trichinella britovi]|uniref:Cell cycle checkpoint protein RAD17 n=1 Tax=Trichinella britovi TaxID=45882 RepID=A0A0V1DEC1_TRIBR|nr:Cell cycle checkpoint protein RAD17 [Trichinella britovi]
MKRKAIKDTAVSLPKTNVGGFAWVSAYQPGHLNQSVVNKRKIAEMRKAIACSLKRDSDSRILLVTGCSGCGKTITVRLLCEDMRIRVVEWKGCIDNGDCVSYFSVSEQLRQFEEFLLRSSHYSTIIQTDEYDNDYQDRVILVKEILPVFTRDPSLLHQILRKFWSTFNIPVIFILTEDGSDGSRAIFPPEVQQNLGILTVSFNAIPVTSIIKHLKNILIQEAKQLDASTLKAVAQFSQGDLRMAVNNLQLICQHDDTSALTPCYRDNFCLLFPALGKFLYDKFGHSSQTVVANSEQDESSESVLPEDTVCKSGLREDIFCLYLFENYLDFRNSLEDIVKISQCFSFVDCLGNWETMEICHPYFASVGARAVSTFYTEKRPLRFQQTRKPQDFLANKNSNLVRHACVPLRESVGGNVLIDKSSFYADYLPYMISKSCLGTNHSSFHMSCVALSGALHDASKLGEEEINESEIIIEQFSDDES